MGWNIILRKNTVKINDFIANALFNTKSDAALCWDDERFVDDSSCIIDQGKLVFNPDWMEHMDYLWDEDIQAVLKRHKVEGVVTFCSHEGDNRGSYWGYVFDGKGGMKKVRGEKNVMKAEKLFAPKRAPKVPKGFKLPKRKTPAQQALETDVDRTLEYVLGVRMGDPREARVRPALVAVMSSSEWKNIKKLCKQR